MENTDLEPVSNNHGSDSGANRPFARTPAWVDLLAAVSVAGVLVFNGLGMSIWLRGVALGLVFIAVILQTRYLGGDDGTPLSYVLFPLAGIVVGFLVGMIVVLLVKMQFTTVPVWLEWLLFVIMAAIGYFGTRLFRVILAKRVAEHS
ncbi:MAG: hypothetical protein SOS98_06665 [Varibaculum sp.]|nr:hypothetical protein [Varibaculum sp.]